MEKKEKTFLIVMIVIFIIIGIATGGIYVYHTFLEKPNPKPAEPAGNTSTVTNSNALSLSAITCVNDNNDRCTKTTEYNFNNTKHQIKVVDTTSKKTDGSECIEVKYDVYIDNKLLGTISNSKMLMCPEDEELVYTTKIDGDLYVINNKYVAVGVGEKTGTYTVGFFSSDKFIGSELLNQSNVNVLKEEVPINKSPEFIEYDGNALKVWSFRCKDGTTEGVQNKGIHVSLGVENDQLVKKILEESPDLKTTGGSASCISVN